MPVLHGDTIAYGDVWDAYCHQHGAYPLNQAHLILPWPGDTMKAIALYMRAASGFSFYDLLYAVLDTRIDGAVDVTEKDIFLVNPGSSSLLTATRHANGRDWWIILPQNKTNGFYIFRLDDQGITLDTLQMIGQPWGEREWASQAVFSPNGEWYIRFNPWKGLDIFRFDRCAGLLSDPIESGPFTQPEMIGCGVAVSVDSRFLYASNVTTLHQFDLEAPDILGSGILIDTFDGFLDPFPVTFYQQALAPDGKIYVFANNGVKRLGVIEDPSKPGKACGFSQHAVSLPAFIDIGSVNMPYYRLGPKDGSPCDTLNIDNKPIAYFRYEVDSMVPTRVMFSNLSYFKPETFHWTFGAQGSSVQQHPGSFTFSKPGVYTVCLEVSNPFGSHTYCLDIDLRDTISTLSENGNGNSTIPMLSPNPFRDVLHLHGLSSGPSCRIDFYSMLGNLVWSVSDVRTGAMLYASHLAAGVYRYTIYKNSGESTREVRPHVSGWIVKTGL